jgi:hypothetical protein
LMLLFIRHVDRSAVKTMREFIMAVKMYERMCDKAWIAVTLEVK